MSEIREQAGSQLVRLGEEGERPLAEPDRRGHVRTPRRTAGGASQPFPRAKRERLGGRVDRSELYAIAVRLLQVITDDLVLLREADLVEPVRKSLVQLGAKLLRHRFIRRVANQQVPEPERVLTGQVGPVGPDQLLPNEGLQVVPHRLA